MLKAFGPKYRQSVWRLLLYTAGALVTIPFNICIESLAVILGLWCRKDEFYVVEKRRELLSQEI